MEFAVARGQVDDSTFMGCSLLHVRAEEASEEHHGVGVNGESPHHIFVFSFMYLWAKGVNFFSIVDKD